MKEYTQAELLVILADHAKWLKTSGKKGRKANLRDAYLSGADLRDAYLSGADLSGADLSGANLRDADLEEADLRFANLRMADLRGADLRGADLRFARLIGANLREANLRGARLIGANLREANLSEANLSGADLRDADLRGANLEYTDGIPPICCPEKGSFTAFKIARGYIVELFIPANAKRSSATSRKCRCSRAKVVSITNIDGSKAHVDCVASTRVSNFLYKVGQYVEVKNFCDDRWNECAPGIHFFITRQEAVDYVY